MIDRDYVLPFSVFPGIGPGRFQLLLSHFGSLNAAYSASEKEFVDVIGLKIAQDFVTFREQFDVSEYKKKLERAHVSYVSILDSDYSTKLTDLTKPPFLLYMKGDKKLLGDGTKRVGIVGTRKMTSYGKQITQSFTKDLVDAGCVVVSGLALGVDATSQQATVDSGGKTIAVLGCGVDCCYPGSNQKLYDNILETGGLIVSEYPLSASPNKGSFPSRNRIIAALSDGVLVTEGAEDSGSLITAEIALKLDRTVFAIPGPVTSSLSKGPLTLIRKGAKLVTSGEEILQELGMKGDNRDRRDKKNIVGETKEEQKVIDCLRYEDLTFDELVRKTKMQSSVVGTVLSMMEMKGIVSSQNNTFALREM